MIQVHSIGDRILPGDYRLHSRFSRAVNLAGPRGLVGVVAPDVGAGPLNLVVSGLDFSRIERLSAGTDGISVDGAPLPPGPVFDSSPPAGPRPRPDSLAAWRKLLLREAHPKSLLFLLDPARRAALRPGFEQALAARLEEGLALLRRGEPACGARAMRGAGIGLTPSGDDFLAGWLWGLRLSGRPDEELDAVYRAGKRADPLAEAFLRCAREGRCGQRLRDLLDALGRGGPEQVVRSARALLAVGATSGADLSTGVLAAVETQEEP